MKKIKKNGINKIISSNLTKNNKGITLIILIITIVVMLILAALTIDLVIDGEVFSFTKKAQNDTEIASEKQAILEASVMAETIGKVGETQAKNLQQFLDEMAGEGTTTVTYKDPKIEIVFNDTGRTYLLDEEGILEGPK